MVAAVSGLAVLSQARSNGRASMMLLARVVPILAPHWWNGPMCRSKFELETKSLAPGTGWLGSLEAGRVTLVESGPSQILSLLTNF